MDDEVRLGVFGPQLSARPDVGQSMTPELAMALAIAEGHKGAGYVAPNPLVGCVILDRQHRFLSAGFHRKVGQEHAEIDAVKSAPLGANFEGAHFFVTLEPCAHQGRTPSCAKSLAAMKVGSVTYAVEDPNPLVAGKGAAILKEAGVKAQSLSERTDFSEESRERLIGMAEDLAEVFLHNMRSGKIFVGVKIASSLDGKMALISGESKWITGEAAREHVQLVRARYDAVAVGHATFAADDPSLNVRHPDFKGLQNKAVVFDPNGKSLASLAKSNLLRVRDPKSVFVVVGDACVADNPAGVTVVRVPQRGGGTFDVGMLLDALKSEGLTSLLVEGGARTIGPLMASGQVGRLHAYLAPILLGGRYGLDWGAGFGRESMNDKIRLSRSIRFDIGDDLYWAARLTHKR
jgi:diaminohydroxyphosphoribosylaminopyrimidine deaminase/5-amino-6-(5-phosphoribosylamino)uracil reductase